MFTNTISNTLGNLKAGVPEFDPDILLDDEVNIKRHWEQWLENFECCITFEGVIDQRNALSKNKVSLLAIGDQKLWELFYTLTPAADSYGTAKTILTKHFLSKKSLTAERFRFFYTKPIDSHKTHDYWITRLRAKVKDCEFDKMDQTGFNSLTIELAKKEVDFLKNSTLHSDTHWSGYQIQQQSKTQ